MSSNGNISEADFLGFLLLEGKFQDRRDHTLFPGASTVPGTQ